MTKRKSAAPGDLAAELATSKERCDAAVAAAEARHADVRTSVIDRGTARVAQISALQAELRDEQEALRAVIIEA